MKPTQRYQQMQRLGNLRVHVDQEQRAWRRSARIALAWSFAMLALASLLSVL